LAILIVATVVAVGLVLAALSGRVTLDGRGIVIKRVTEDRLVAATLAPAGLWLLFAGGIV
jgi:hypothetical protein